MLSSITPNTSNSTMVMTPPPEKSDAAPFGTDGASRYQAARDKIYDTVGELEQLDAAVAATRKKHHKLQEDLEHSIDVEMRRFITSYKLNVTENEARERRIAENQESQTFLRAELEELEEEEEMLQNALKQSKTERKRLRTSVSARDLAFLQLGQDLAHADAKRLRFDDSGEE